MIITASVVLGVFTAFTCGIYIGSNIKYRLIKDRLAKAEDRGFSKALGVFTAERQFYINRIDRLTQQLRTINNRANYVR